MHYFRICTNSQTRSTRCVCDLSKAYEFGEKDDLLFGLEDDEQMKSIRDNKTSQ